MATIRYDQFSPHFDWLLDLGYERIHDEETRWGVWQSATTRIALFHAELDEHVSVAIWPRTSWHWRDDNPWYVDLPQLAEALGVPPPQLEYLDTELTPESILDGISAWLQGPGGEAVEGRAGDLLTSIVLRQPLPVVPSYRYPTHGAWCETPDGGRMLAVPWVMRLTYERLVEMTHSPDRFGRAVAALQLRSTARRERIEDDEARAILLHLLEDPDEDVRRNASVMLAHRDPVPRDELVAAFHRETRDGPSSALYALAWEAFRLPPEQRAEFAALLREVEETRPGAADQVRHLRRSTDLRIGLHR